MKESLTVSKTQLEEFCNKLDQWARVYADKAVNYSYPLKRGSYLGRHDAYMEVRDWMQREFHLESSNSKRC